MKYTFLFIALIALISFSSNAANSSPDKVHSTPYDSTQDTTVEGRDEDENGIRDDIDNFVENTYSTGDNQTYLRAIAYSINQSIIDHESHQTIRDLPVLNMQIVQCARLKKAEAIDYSGEIYARTINTEGRLAALVKYRQKIGGQAVSFFHDEELPEICTSLENKFGY